MTVVTATIREIFGLVEVHNHALTGQSVLAYANPVTMLGACVALFAGIFAFGKRHCRFAKPAPRHGSTAVLDTPKR